MAGGRSVHFVNLIENLTSGYMYVCLDFFSRRQLGQRIILSVWLMQNLNTVISVL